MTPLETEIQKQCLSYLHLRGIYCWRSNNTPIYDPRRGVYRSFRGLRGVSDILGILDDGRFFACEIKRPGKTLRPEQEKFLDEVSTRGGVGIWVSSVDELKEDLDVILKSKGVQ